MCYDPNYRAALWERPDQALDALIEVIPYVDVVLPSWEDLKPLFNFSDMEHALDYFRIRGVTLVAIKQGSQGVTVAFKRWHTQLPPMPLNHEVVDTIGAGDAFNGGFLFGLLHHLSLEDCARVGMYCATQSLSRTGPIAGLPNLDELLQALPQLVQQLTPQEDDSVLMYPEPQAVG